MASVPVDQEMPGVNSAGCHECNKQEKRGLSPSVCYTTDSLCAYTPVEHK